MSLDPALPFQKEAAGGKTVVSIYGTADGEVMLRWEPAPEERAVETIAFASQQQVLGISAGLLHVDAQIDYTLLQGRMPEALVALPEGYSLLKVSGDNVRTWDTRKDAAGGSTLVVTLGDPTAPATRLTLTLEKTLGAVPVVIDAPQVAVQGVAREKGLVAVALEKGLQAEIVEKQGIGQVNLSDVPDSLAREDGGRQPGAALPGAALQADAARLHHRTEGLRRGELPDRGEHGEVPPVVGRPV